MKKKLIAITLLLCVAVTMGLSGCNSAAPANAGRTPMTFTLYTIVEPGTTPEAIDQVQTALNNITEPRFRTHIVLRAYTADQYQAALQQAFSDIDAQKAEQQAISASIQSSQDESRSIDRENKLKGITTKATFTRRTDATTEPLTLKVVYPEVTGPQADIFLVTSFSDLVNLVNDPSGESRVASLNDELTGNAKILNQFMLPSVFTAGSVNGTTYAIPTNTAFGEYTYLAIDKTLADKYALDTTTIKDVQDLTPFLESVKAGEPGVTPLVGNLSLDKYFDFINGDPTFPIASTAASSPKGGSASLVDIFANTQAANMFTFISTVKSEGLWSQTASGKAAVTIQQGTLADYNDWVAANGDSMYYVPVEAPRISNEDAGQAMYCVNADTQDVSRAMEIITTMNTSPTFKNVFTYGILNTHYKLTADNQAEMISSDYSVNPLYTGNEYIGLTPSTGPTDIWKTYQQQNLAAIPSTLLGLSLDMTKLTATDATTGATTPIDATKLASIGAQYYNELISGSIPPDQVADTLTQAQADLTAAGVADAITSLSSQLPAPPSAS